jgi:hypothetical protein
MYSSPNMILIISVPLKEAFQMVNFSFETLCHKGFWHIGLVSLVVCFCAGWIVYTISDGANSSEWIQPHKVFNYFLWLVTTNSTLFVCFHDGLLHWENSYIILIAVCWFITLSKYMTAAYDGSELTD